jgi:hypothetical protein
MNGAGSAGVLPESRVELVPLGQTASRGDGGAAAEAVMTFGCPLVHRVDPTGFPDEFRRIALSQGWEFARVLFPMTLERAAPGRQFVDVTIRVRFSSPDCLAVDLESPRSVTVDGGFVGAFALRPVRVVAPEFAAGPSLPEGVIVEASGYARRQVLWRLHHEAGGLVPAGDLVTAAVIAVPAGTDVVAGTVGADVSVRRPVVGSLTSISRVIVRSARPAPFTVGLADGSLAGFRPVVAPRSRPGAAASRLCVAVDAEGYGRRDLAGQLRVQSRLVQVLDEVGGAVGLDRSWWDRQDQGDGELALMPAGTDVAELAPGIVRSMADSLDELNQDLVEQARLRLRLALHEGEIRRGASGYAGDAAVVVCRLRDSEELRAALRASPDAPLAVGVTESLFADIAEGFEPGDCSQNAGRAPARMTVIQESKGFRVDARIWVAGGV